MSSSDQTVILATGAALVGVVAGFFVMLHLAGGAAGAAPPPQGTRRNPIERHPIVRVVLTGGGPGRRRGTQVPWTATAYDDRGWQRSRVSDVDRVYVDRKIAEFWPGVPVEVAT